MTTRQMCSIHEDCMYWSLDATQCSRYQKRVLWYKAMRLFDFGGDMERRMQSAVHAALIAFVGILAVGAAGAGFMVLFDLW